MTEQFLQDIIHMTRGELLLKYWWLIIVLNGLAVVITQIVARRK